MSKIVRTDWVSDWLGGKGPDRGRNNSCDFEMVEGGIVQEKKKQPDDAGPGKL